MHASTARIAFILALATVSAERCHGGGLEVKAGPPKGPRDLPYYNIPWAKGLSLEDMKVEVVERSTVPGGKILLVTYSAFEQPFATRKVVVTVPWRQCATLCLPTGPLKKNKAFAYNTHDFNIRDPKINQGLAGLAASIAIPFGIPAMIHGWDPKVVDAVEGKDHGSTQAGLLDRLFEAGITDASKMPMDGRYLFNGNPLAKADMVSLTLLQRLVEEETGTTIEQIAAAGGSREGIAHWVLGDLDDRVAVLVVGGSYFENTPELVARYGKDWDWRFPWKGGATDPAYAGLRKLFDNIWRLGDWINTTDAGALVDRTSMSPECWAPRLRAKHVLIFGDLGVIPGQHDIIPILAERGFLQRFRHPSWRYVRTYDRPGVTLGDGVKEHELGRGVFFQTADLLLDDITTPTTPTVRWTEQRPRQVRIHATSNTAPSLKSVAAVVYAIAPTRGLHDPDLWKTSMMKPAGAGKWEADLPEVPQGCGLTFLVSVREAATRGSLSYWRSAASIPEELFPLPEHTNPGPKWRP